MAINFRMGVGVGRLGVHHIFSGRRPPGPDFVGHSEIEDEHWRGKRDLSQGGSITHTSFLMLLSPWLYHQGIQELVEGGRYKFITTGETNTIMLCIRKAKPQDEGYYKVVIANEHGEDSAEFQLFVSGECSGRSARQTYPVSGPSAFGRCRAPVLCIICGRKIP